MSVQSPECLDESAAALDPTRTKERLLNEFNPCVPVREVRAAVSMVGGSALCIYENGVTQELYSMVQGQGVYALVKRLTQSHACVDILSGTSAGGINSVFLAAALAMKKDVWSTREVWTSLGDIDLLLQSPEDRGAASLLRGNGFALPQLERAIRLIANSASARKAPLPSGQLGQGAASESADLDLFVTGTYLTGQPRVFFDARNQPIFSEDFKGVFHLKHRPERGESHFDPSFREPAHTVEGRRVEPGKRSDADAVYRRLARIARATSSLPAIFEPTEVEASLMNGVIELPNCGKGQSGKVFMGDGGYLNNRPLNLVLEEVFRRSETRAVVRKVFLVDPEADEPGRRQPECPTAPSAVQHLRLWRKIQSQQNLAGSLEEIYQHNIRARTVRETLEQARALGRETSHPEVSAQQRELWLSIRRLDLRDYLIGCWLREEGLDGFGSVEHGEAEDRLAAGPARRERANQLSSLRGRLITLFDYEASQPRERPGNASFLEEVDLAFLCRKIARAADAVYELVDPDPQYRKTEAAFLGVRQSEELGLVLDRLHHLRRCVESLQESAEQVLQALTRTLEYREALSTSPARDCPGFDPNVRTLWMLVRRAMLHMLSAGALTGQPAGHSPAEVKKATRQWCAEVERRCAAVREALVRTGQLDHLLAAPPEPPGLPAVLDWINRELAFCLDDAHRIAAGAGSGDARNPGLLPAGGDGIRWLEMLDAFVLPIERAASLPSVNPVELVEIGARSVHSGLSAPSAAEKLAGESLAHFAGFMRRSWRANDILWGRLDGCAALVETLLDRARLERVLESDERSSAGSTQPDTAMLQAIDAFVLRGRCLEDDGTDWPREDDAVGAYLRSYYCDGHCKPTRRESIHAWLRARAGRSADLADETPEPDSDEHPGYRALVDCLVMRHQLDILVEEMPTVLGEALSEDADWQAKWGGAAGPPRTHGIASTPQVRHDAARETKALRRMAGATTDNTGFQAFRLYASEVAEGLFRKKGGTPDVPRLVEFFHSTYRMGEETVLGDIPPLVNARRAMCALRVSLNLADRELQAVEADPAVKGARTLLRATAWTAGLLHYFLEVLGRGSRVAVAAHTAAWGAIALALAAFIFPGAFGKSTAWLIPLGLVAFLAEAVTGWLLARKVPLLGGLAALAAALFAVNGLGHAGKGGLLVSALLHGYAPQVVSLAALIWVVMAATWMEKQSHHPPLGWAAVLIAAAGVAWTGIWVDYHGLPRVLPVLDPSVFGSGWLGLALIVSAACFVAALRYVNRPMAAMSPSAMLDFEFIGSARRARRLIGEWGDPQRWAVRISLLRDFALIPVYVWTLWLACQLARYAFRAESQHGWYSFCSAAGLVISWGVVLAGVLDVVENGALLSMVQPGQPEEPKIGHRAPGLASLATHGKWALLWMGVIYPLLGLLAWILGRL